MSKSSTVTIACALCVGARREHYLEAMLASIAGVVDLLVVNDNSGERHSENLATIETSAFGDGGRLRVFHHPMTDFAEMRNLAFAPLLSLEKPPDWVLFIDADEIHGEQIRSIAASILPHLDRSAATLEGYTFHFFGTFGWISDVARRLIFYRFSPQIRWVNPIHEKMIGLPGKTLVLPYVFHHYGNVVPPEQLAAKHEQFYGLGQPRAKAASPDGREIYLMKARRVRPYRGSHPAAARSVIAKLEALLGDEFAVLDEAFRTRRTPLIRLAGSLRGLHEWLRVELRRFEHPGLYRGPTVAS